MQLLSRLDITQSFCDVDDFCQQFQRLWQQAQLPAIAREKLSSSRMYLSEIMTNALQARYANFIAFHGSGYRTFKEFYTLQVLPGWRGAFPNLVTYNRFVELMPWTLMTLCCYLHSRKGEVTGISFVDFTQARSVSRSFTPYHKVFKEYVAWGKDSVDGVYGFSGDSLAGHSTDRTFWD